MQVYLEDFKDILKPVKELFNIFQSWWTKTFVIIFLSQRNILQITVSMICQESILEHNVSQYRVRTSLHAIYLRVEVIFTARRLDKQD